MARQRKPRKMGRPPLPPGEKKLPSVGFRPTPELKSWLDQAAKENGRSVSKEIESRLEQSRQITESFGGNESHSRLLLLSQWANWVVGADWHKDVTSLKKTLGAWRGLVELLAGLSVDSTKPSGKTIEINPFLFDTPEVAGFEEAIKKAQAAAEKMAAERG